MTILFLCNWTVALLILTHTLETTLSWAFLLSRPRTCPTYPPFLECVSLSVSCIALWYAHTHSHTPPHTHSRTVAQLHRPLRACVSLHPLRAASRNLSKPFHLSKPSQHDLLTSSRCTSEACLYLIFIHSHPEVTD